MELFKYNTKSIFDLIVISNDLSDKFNYFKVHSDSLTSEHYLAKGSLNIKTIKTIEDMKTDMNSFKIKLEEQLSIWIESLVGFHDGAGTGIGEILLIN
ncbi:hypothetical protein BpHYR1_010256 [Brachionus plicatilis]|uniref:RNA-directed DNA polymerase from mobile element jockey-like n=1 Tax=Brachionus plicatilis TaxID=10195 RepID=A0A3M7R5X6_BRAPC|nr:hypothetical protein BpHYR1_010256 [Brachionus plicatilis]